jgi:hypothetical protein
LQKIVKQSHKQNSRVVAMIQSSLHEKNKKIAMVPTINFESPLEFSYFNKMGRSTIIEVHNKNAF